MNKRKKDQHVRELELSRDLARVLDTLPYEAVCNVFAALFDMYRGDPNNPVSLGTFSEYSDKKRSNIRFDVFVPLSTTFTLNSSDKLFRELIFETKLGQANEGQLKEYTEKSPNALVISLAKEKTDTVGIERCVNLTWDDFVGGLITFLGSDARDRLNLPEGFGQECEFQPEVPQRFIGRECEARLEDFIRAIIAKGLVTNPERYIVVTGAIATKGCNQYNCYAYGAKWDQNFSNLVIIHHKKVQYVGKVQKRFTDVEIEDGKLLEPKEAESGSDIMGFIDYWKESYPNWKGPIITLKKVDDHNLPTEYGGKGAFTFSHRYFDTKEDLIKALRK